MTAPVGTTLVELLVVLVIIGTLTTIAAVALPRREVPVRSTAARVAATQLEAAATGRSLRLSDDSERAVLVLPDGSVLGPGFDLLTGAPHAAR